MSNVPITAGVGTIIATDLVSTVNYQIVKLDVGGLGSTLPVSAGGANYLPVNLAAIAGGLNLPVSPATGAQFGVINAPSTTLAISASSAIPVSAVVGSPVFVRLSDGTNPIATLPVSGTITANQGTPAANANAWPTLLTDGTHQASLTNFSGNYALNVNVLGTVNAGGVQVDNTTFTVGSGSVSVAGAMYNDAATAPTAGQAAALRMTANRALHINIRNAAGTEIGTSSNPVRTDPTGVTTQPVSGTISAQVTQWGGSNVVSAAAGIPKVGVSDASGNAFTDANPLTVQIGATGRVRVTKSVALSASQTSAALWTPAGGKKFVITYINLVVTTAGPLKWFDSTDTASTRFADSSTGANWPTGVFNFDMAGAPWASATVGNVLNYTSGTGLVGVMTLHGYEE